MPCGTPFEQVYIDGATASFACLRSRLTVAREMRCVLAISLRLWPRLRFWRTAIRSISSGRRPICLPSNRARRIPARTRSMIRFRSSSAMAPMMMTTARPSGPVSRFSRS